ncbi:MAG: hypothetical protein LBN18_07370 [Dysgonamonadaceae bacterium]|jgi:HTH-type transcriptional regulator/antitoxin HigA|nr:hypothetical protein [Dysgonamonadaceae bacterium]
MKIVSHSKLKQFYETKGYEDSRVALKQYKLAVAKIEELLPLVNDNTPANDPKARELSLVSDMVIEYENTHFLIGKPTVDELVALSLEEKEVIRKKEYHLQLC